MATKKKTNAKAKKKALRSTAKSAAASRRTSKFAAASRPTKKPSAAARRRGAATTTKKAARKKAPARKASARAAKPAVTARAAKPAATARVAKPAATARTAKPAPAKKAKRTAPVRRRDGAGHLDPQYAADLRAKIESGRPPDEPSSFLERPRSTDDLVEELGEEVINEATSAEHEGEDILDQEVPEERGGPFVETTGAEEFGHGIDASNPRGAKREPFPRT